MRFLIAILLAVACALPLFAETAKGPATLQDAKELGRAKSLFLREDRQNSPSSQAIPKANLADFEKSIGPLLKKSCLTCHGPQKAEGRLRIDKLDPNLLSGTDAARWREVYNVLGNSEMPPEDSAPNKALLDADRGDIVDWLSAELSKASLIRRHTKEHSSFRRLTKYEYNYALQDLLGLPFPLADKLPPETPSEDGFKNSSELLQMSPMQFETHRELGLKALKHATVSGERPTSVSYIISMQEEFKKAAAGKDKTFETNGPSYQGNSRRVHLVNRESERGVRFSNGKPSHSTEATVGQTPAVSPVVLVLPRSNELKLNLDRFLPDEGIMRVRIRAGRSTMNDKEHASLRLMFSAHTSNNANFSEVISERDIPVTAPADDPQFIHFDIPLGDIQRNPFRKLSTTFPRRDEFLHIRSISNATNTKDGLKVVIDHIEITAPFYERWPPKTHSKIFIDSKNKSDEPTYAREVLSKFLRRAWRRPVTSQDVEPLVTLFTEYRTGFSNFEDAMVEVLATALVSPEFLYLTQTTSSDSDDTISQFELASRLAMFLWSSIPDDQLLELAEQERLNEPKVLAGQVDRMLADPRAQRFSRHFVEQWLGLDALNSVVHVNDETLIEAMREEPVAFFDEVLRGDRSVLDFIHSDYAVVNERLARHYGIADVYGPHFRKVPIEAQVHRGGILTGAAMLAMNSDGKDSHPLKRGVWMLERILNDPPPPPPPNVPEVDLTDPRILKMTLKERIADHRNKPACYSCHSRIDPWGIAFENYDAFGAYRSNSAQVNSAATLFNKQTLNGMEGLKRFLLVNRQDQIAQAVVHKMTAYALGRPLSFGDQTDIDALTAKLRKRNDRLSDLIRLIATSDLFHSK